ncbi:hypothetical protein EVAR_58017_1 [Eumeta japonica]|uniref:Uncharacterized protein n=1 Tax=Eumeta variegata TaxID=151549 RepID=A0A4C1Y7M2_EUMVA|nr:hypothetical protein EVAR_58017_1 [Eumeta japonica]
MPDDCYSMSVSADAMPEVAASEYACCPISPTSPHTPSINGYPIPTRDASNAMYKIEVAVTDVVQFTGTAYILVPTPHDLCEHITFKVEGGSTQGPADPLTARNQRSRYSYSGVRLKGVPGTFSRCCRPVGGATFRPSCRCVRGDRAVRGGARGGRYHSAHPDLERATSSPDRAVKCSMYDRKLRQETELTSPTPLHRGVMRLLFL